MHALLPRALFALRADDSEPLAIDDGSTETHTEGGSPVVAFIIGFAIVLLASILNAAGLNLTKLDHVHHGAAVSPFDR